MAKKDSPTEQLKAWRDGRPYTKAAPELEMNPTVLAKIEQGKYVPGRKVAKRIRAVVGIPCEAWGDKAA